MLSNGMMLSQRYEILELVGSGGMADVYKARDRRLNRDVAIKILKEEHHSDKKFLTNFRKEAQSVARLSHPSIVNVFDVEEDNDLHYIVMEFVEGLTLKKIIDRKGRLPVSEAIGIAIRIGEGIEAAHSSGIIHRDIKPQNIIISNNGTVKITDFGIAKVATSNTIAVGQPTGSVYYISPEQARGGYLDERSDIYSLGVTLYEMLSGRPPFSADNTVSIALLHMNEDAVPLRKLLPELPSSVEKIVSKCMQKKPERRYLTVSDLISDLKKSISEPEGNFVKLDVYDDPNSPTKLISNEDLHRIKSQRFKEGADIVSEEHDKNRRAPLGDESDLDPKMEKWILIGGIIAIVALAIVIIFLVIKGFNLLGGDKKGVVLNESSSSMAEEKGSETKSKLSSEKTTEEKKNNDVSTTDNEDATKVPDLTGKTVAEAIELLKEAGITSYHYNYEVSKDFKKDTIISVKPEAGTEIKKKDEVVLLVSSGEKLVSVPELKDIPKATAVSTLEGMKFVVKTEDEFSEEIEEGKVIGTKPAFGTELREGDEVLVLISKGPQFKKSAVPDVVGKREVDAIRLIEGAKLRAEVTYENNDLEEGRVVSQDVLAGEEVEEGSTVTVVVSKGAKKTVIYTSSIVIDANPFAEEGESGTVEIKLDQDGRTSVIYSKVTSYEDFPLELDGIKGASDSDATCYMYKDGELFTDKYWTISSWNKAEVDE